ncbi:MAG: glycosyl hydrolase family 65 protein [Lachnospiraceae bacterium]|nr:glycosyl hydrolase family 65 protein [Lachnospiraceae bacterium]
MRTDKKPIYPVEPWTITETAFEVKNNYRNETTFALSNGYIGTRGTFEEAYPFDIDTGLEGNFVNGFYESEQIRYGEANFGSPLLSQSLLNLPNLKETALYLDGEKFDMREGKAEEYSRTLYMKDGVLVRRLIWTSPSGKKAEICIRRLVSFAMKNIMAISYQATPLNFDGELCFVSRLNGDVENHTRKTNPIVDYGPFGRKLEPICLKADEKEGSLYYEGVTQTSRLTVGCGSIHRIFAGKAGEECNLENAKPGRKTKTQAVDVLTDTDGRKTKTQAAAVLLGTDSETHTYDASLSFRVSAKRGVTVTLEKMICYSTSLDSAADDLAEFVSGTLAEAGALGYEELERRQKEYLHRFWETADIEILGEGNDALSQGVRFNLFHIFQAAGRDGRTGMGAKGLSGEGYEGHYFWDTEMYIMPVFTYTEPEVTKRLLEYRYDTLPQARQRARILGHPQGALFPWRTINGEEASTYYPLGTAQYHINADIEYALALYLQATGDVKFFKEKGAEILIETARVWADVGSFAECKGGKYCICSVTGPDEYNVLVDNNFYTNLMAREHLRDAVTAVEYLQREDPDTLQRLISRLDFDLSEAEVWKRIVENMYFPYDETRRVYPLDDGFMMRRPWDESRIPPEKRAWLYENYHPLFIMRHRMSKQADAILGMYLHSNLFSDEELRRNYDFYQEVTLHHSSLSTCIFGIVACDIGTRLQHAAAGTAPEHEADPYFQEAYEYFSQSARMDLDDYHNNFYAGIHAANMAGTWQAIVNGFAGLRCFDGKLSFRPYLPKAWEGYRFCLRFRDAVLRVEITQGEAKFTLAEGERISFAVYGNEITITERGGNYVQKI